MKRKLRLYVWLDVLTDYSSGVMFALAYSPAHARRLILKKCSYVPKEDLSKEPICVRKPEAFLVWGGV